MPISASVFALISEAAQRQIVPSAEVQGTITLRLIDVPWDQALDAILSIYSLKRVDEGSDHPDPPPGKIIMKKGPAVAATGIVTPFFQNSKRIPVRRI